MSKLSNVQDRSTSSPNSCSIEATVAVVGDRWSLLILRNVFRGRHRFSLLQQDLGIAKNLLTDRLGKLTDNGLLARVQYQERPPRFEYRLTPKGADFSASLIALMQWGDRWYANESPPTVLVHDSCQSPLDLRVSCPTCDLVVRPGEISSQPGPGRSQS